MRDADLLRAECPGLFVARTQPGRSGSPSVCGWLEQASMVSDFAFLPGGGRTVPRDRRFPHMIGVKGTLLAPLPAGAPPGATEPSSCRHQPLTSREPPL